MKKRRKLMPQYTNEGVARKLYDNFRFADTVSTDVRKVGGLTLRGRIKQDVYRCRQDPSFKMGAQYYKELKALYLQAGAVTENLQVSNPSDSVCPKLMNAIMGA